MTDKADEQVERNLRNWASWMHSGGLPNGCPTKASGGVKGYTSMDLDNVAAYENLDLWLAENTHAAINDLVPIESCAIHNAYLNAVWRFTRHDMRETLSNAKRNLKPLMKMRNIWLGE